MAIAGDWRAGSGNRTPAERAEHEGDALRLANDTEYGLAAQSAHWAPAGEDRQLGLRLACFVFPLEGLATIMAFSPRDTLAPTVL